MIEKIAVNKKMLLTLSEVAELTSSSVSWWRQAVRGEKELPSGVVALRHGKIWKISRASIEEWISGAAVAPPARRRGRPTKEEQIARERQVLRKE